MSNAVYEIVTDRIVSLLESGTCPWRRPWATTRLLPRNLASGRPYSGINMLLLSCVGHESSYYLTFRQVAERGGSVRKGSKGLPVIYWRAPDKAEAAESEEDEDRRAGTRVPLLRYYTVFNARQIEGVEFPAAPTRAEIPFSPVEAAEEVVAGWRDGPKVEHGFARDLSGGFSGETYSREELVAEMCAAFLCARCGIDGPVIPNQASYIAGWVRALRGDPRMVVRAAGQAQRAARLITRE